MGALATASQVRNLTAMFSSVQRPIGAAVLGLALLGLTACGDGDGGSTASTVAIQPSSYVVRDPATTTTLPAVNEPTADGRSPLEQAYVITSSRDVPYSIAKMYDIPLDDLRNFNGWEEETYAGFPGVGGTVRIPPGAKFIDLSTTTTTAAATANSDDTGEGDTTTTAPAGGDRCAPTYVIEDGDAPLVITRKFDITLEQLNAANTATANWPNLYTGATINLPAPADCAGGTATVTTTTVAG